MYTKNDLIADLKAMGVRPEGTLAVHSSMKAIGQVDGGADTVLDALSEYMKDGLLLLPAHTWRQICPEYPVFNAATESACTGLLSNMFMKRAGVVRSLHPTHSISALGREAEAYVQGEEKFDTPCPREGCWGRLYDRQAQVLLLGCGLNRYTFVHSVEEWLDVPGRLTEEAEQYTVIAPDGARYAVSQHRHIGRISENFLKMDRIFLDAGVMKMGRFGDAECRLCDVVRTAEVVTEYLSRDPDLFGDDAPVKFELGK